MLNVRSSWLEISLSALRHNFELLKSKIDPSTLICPVVKANAYGHGIVPISQALLKFGCDRLAVARAREALQLRDAGVTCPIHIVGSLQLEDVADVVKAGAIPSLTTLSTAAKLAELSPGAEVHVIIDSGMNRVGVQEGLLDDFMRDIAKIDVRVTGFYTHMASADEPDEVEFTREQLSKFRRLSGKFTAHGFIRHAANSATIMKYATEGQFDMVRPGVAIYGLPPSGWFVDAGLKPIATWKAYPSQIKKLNHGDTVGYGRTWTAAGGEWIATIPVGYGDGFSRKFSNSENGVRISDTGELCPIVGRVSMDQITVLLPREVGLETVFVIISNDGDAVTSMGGRAQALGTINYEIATSLADRVPRFYLDD